MHVGVKVDCDPFCLLVSLASCVGLRLLAPRRRVAIFVCTLSSQQLCLSLLFSTEGVHDNLCGRSRPAPTVRLTAPHAHSCDWHHAQVSALNAPHLLCSLLTTTP